jgi:uncharacterized protein YcbK (DUF882 family)
MQLSPHFSLAELTRTSRDIPNEPDDAALTRLRLLCSEVLEPIRLLWGVPIRINSGFRSAAVNAAIGGAKGSQHLRGEAADVVPVGMSAEKAMEMLAKAVARGELPKLGQGIIYASGFLHVSIDIATKPRQQLLRSSAAGGSGGPYHAYRVAS